MPTAYAVIQDAALDFTCIKKCEMEGGTTQACESQCKGSPYTPPEISGMIDNNYITECDSKGYCSKCLDNNKNGICDDIENLFPGNVPDDPDPLPPDEPAPNVKVNPNTFNSSSGKATVFFASEFNTTIQGADDTLVELVIDTNGTKNKPNMYGRDAFRFKLLNNGKLEPFGKDSYATDCADGNIKNGRACTARVIADDWNIKY